MLFAFFIPSTMGRVLLVVPVSLAIADQLGFSPGSPGRNGMVMAAALSCFAPSCAILPSNVPNMVLVGASESVYDFTFKYTDYLKLHYPVIGFLKGLTIIILTPSLYHAEVHRHPVNKRKEHRPVSKQEGVVIFVLLGTLLLWGTDFLHGVSPAWVALGAAIIFLLPFMGLVPVEVFTQKMNFGPLFYVAGVLGLGAVVAWTGLGEVFGEALLSVIPFRQDQALRNFFWLVFIATGLNTVTTAASLPAVMTPFASDLAKATGFPLGTVLMTQVLGFSNPLLPYQVPPVIVGMQLGGVSATQGARLTITLAAVSILVLMPVNYAWWRLLGAFAG
jgi:hypothetical protein